MIPVYDMMKRSHEMDQSGTTIVPSAGSMQAQVDFVVQPARCHAAKKACQASC